MLNRTTFRGILKITFLWLSLPAAAQEMPKSFALIRKSTEQPGPKFSSDWHLKSPEIDTIFGTSVNRAYQELLKGKTSTRVIVGILDSGLDTDHKALKNAVWINTAEIAGNGIDDDHNGYIDDVNGWNFLGSADQLTDYDKISTEANREYLRLKKKYAHKDTTNLNVADKKYLNQVKKISALYGSERVLQNLKAAGKDGKAIAGAQQYYDMDLKEAETDDVVLRGAKVRGNSKVNVVTASHGTHVSGIVAADREDLKVKGIASNAAIMMVRVVPAKGDEYDEDVAKAIRYAVDNGARVINMSFGKQFSPGKKKVDQAIRYAEKKDVLIVHASGNDGMDTDETPFYPNPFFKGGGKAANVITVGGSDLRGNKISISNYGRQTVDLFAPGESIYNTDVKGYYTTKTGTSMAGPMVTGVAALIRGYYPKLNAVQVKEILMKTVYPVAGFKDISVTGGIVDAYKALQMAAEMAK